MTTTTTTKTTPSRVCRNCGGPIPDTRTKMASFCCDKCRVAFANAKYKQDRGSRNNTKFLVSETNPHSAYAAFVRTSRAKAKHGWGAVDATTHRHTDYHTGDVVQTRGVYGMSRH